MKTNQEKEFYQFKNLLLGTTFLHDGNAWAKVMGEVDYIFWQHIRECEPYADSLFRDELNNITKGKIILERLQLEENPKRMADLLQGIYESLAHHSFIPKYEGSDWWRVYVSRLESRADQVGFSDLKISWISQPEQTFTEDITHERYYIPGELLITYTGLDFNVGKSTIFLKEGFRSKILKAAIEEIQSKKREDKKIREKKMALWSKILQLLQELIKKIPGF